MTVYLPVREDSSLMRFNRGRYVYQTIEEVQSVIASMPSGEGVYQICYVDADFERDCTLVDGMPYRKLNVEMPIHVVRSNDPPPGAGTEAKA